MRHLLFIMTFACLSFFADAQQKNPTQLVPKLTVSLGGLKSGKATVPQLKQHLDSALYAVDEKGRRYPVIRFRLLYFFDSEFEDAETAVSITKREFRAMDFYDTDQLTEIWRASIRDNAKKGDELRISNVAVRLKNGKSIYTPELKLGIE
jgi:hypothetical protein